MKKNPGRKERRHIMFLNRRTVGKVKAGLHDAHMKIEANKARKRKSNRVKTNA